MENNTLQILRYKAFLEMPNLFLKTPLDSINIFHLPIPTTFNSLGVSSSPMVFGKRMERYFSSAINVSDRYTLLLENAQIIENKITKGELDFIVKDKLENQIIHVELVCKFYVYDPTISDASKRWIGPNRNDALHIKLNRLKNHQFPLLYDKSTQKVLAEKNSELTNMSQALCFKALLFLPFDLEVKMDNLNKECIFGRWIKASDFFKNKGVGQYYLPEKSDWAVRPHQNVNWKELDEVEQEIKSLLRREKSPLCWVMKDNECYSVFIVWW